MKFLNLESGIRCWFRRLAGVAASLIPLLAGPQAYAQGCAMCANDASALKAHALAALRSGVLILLVPPLLFFVGIFAVAFRRRDPPLADWDADADRELDELWHSHSWLCDPALRQAQDRERSRTAGTAQARPACRRQGA